MQPPINVPLATSVSISELVQSETTQSSDASVVPELATEGLARGEASETHPVLEEISQLGRSQQLHQVAHLARYVYHADSVVRVAVAFALGELAATRQGKGVEAIVPILSKLAQDANPQVRLQAVAALGSIQSPIVLPLLQQAQRQSDSKVSKAASAALQHLKYVQPSKKLAAETFNRSRKTR